MLSAKYAIYIYMQNISRMDEYANYAEYETNIQNTAMDVLGSRPSRQGASSAKWGVQYAQFAKYVTIYAMIRNRQIC